jgi:hypothetical protein
MLRRHARADELIVGGGRRGEGAGELHQLVGLLGGEIVEHEGPPVVQDGQLRSLGLQDPTAINKKNKKKLTTPA